MDHKQCKPVPGRNDDSNNPTRPKTIEWNNNNCVISFLGFHTKRTIQVRRTKKQTILIR